MGNEFTDAEKDALWKIARDVGLLFFALSGSDSFEQALFRFAAGVAELLEAERG